MLEDAVSVFVSAEDQFCLMTWCWDVLAGWTGEVAPDN